MRLRPSNRVIATHQLVAWDELGRIRRRGYETAEHLRWVRANYVDQFLVKAILLEGATQDEAAFHLGLSKRDVSAHANTPYRPTAVPMDSDTWQVDSDYLAHIFGSADRAADARRLALRYDAKNFAPYDVYKMEPDELVGVVAVLHSKGGAGGDVVTFGLSRALMVDAARNVHPVSLDPTIDRPDRTWESVKRHSADSLMIVDCSTTNDQVDAVLGDAGMVVYVMPTDPKTENPITGAKPPHEAQIPPFLRDDPRLVVVVNDGAGPQGMPTGVSLGERLQHGPPLAAHVSGGVFRVPFDRRIAERGYSDPVEFHELAANTWDSFMRLADAVTAQLRRDQ